MRSRQSFRFLFILYCIEAGVVLLMAPWSANWEGIVLAQPIQSLREPLLLGVVRGAISGFGLVHLVWAVHDLLDWLAARSKASRDKKARAEGAVDPTTETVAAQSTRRDTE